MSRGCDREHIQDLIEHVNVKLFNDKMHARNCKFEQQRKSHEDLECKDLKWTRRWTEEHPIGAGETDWSSHSKQSQQVMFKDLGTDPNAYRENRQFYRMWGDEEAFGQLAKVVHDLSVLTRDILVCDECGFRTSTMNRICPFCKRHIGELANTGVLDGTQATSGSSRIIQRLAKCRITDNDDPGFAFPYRGMRSPLWKQMQTLLKIGKSWTEERTWFYNSETPGQAYTSLLDRIKKDHVFRLNLILHGGWTKDTFYILIELIDLARDRKAWDQKYGHLSYQDRREYYRRRADRFKKQSRRGDSDESRVQREDEPTPNDQARVAERQERHLGKGPGIAAATRAPTAGPEPETKFSEFWQFREMARWGYPSVPDLLQGTESENLPYQLGAPDGAAGSSTDTQLVQAVPHPKEEIFECLQCGEPSALTNLWQCNRCSRMMGKAVYFHCPSRYKNCYSAHAHYCESQSLFGWCRTQQKR